MKERFIAETKTRIVKHATDTNTRRGPHARSRRVVRGRGGVTGRCGVVAARGKGGDGPRGEGVEWDGTIDRVALVASGSKKSRRAKSDGRGR